MFKYLGVSIQHTPALANVVALKTKQKRLLENDKDIENQLYFSSQNLCQFTESMKSNFDEIRTEQAIILHDNLELHERFKF